MPAKNHNAVREWFNTIFYGGLIAILFRSLLLEPFNIPSGSMIPSLHVGELPPFGGVNWLRRELTTKSSLWINELDY